MSKHIFACHGRVTCFVCLNGRFLSLDGQDWSWSQFYETRHKKMLKRLCLIGKWLLPFDRLVFRVLGLLKSKQG